MPFISVSEQFDNKWILLISLGQANDNQGV